MLLKFYIFFSIGIILFLTGCASSDLTRTAASGVDKTYSVADSLINGAGGVSPVAAWDDASQMQKGMIIGGTTGALAGGLSGVGWLTGAASGALFGGAMGAWVDSHTTLADQLRNQGANVLVLGDQVRIVLPSSHLFNEYTSSLSSYAPHTLNIVANLVSTYPNRSVTIAAYSDPSVRHREALTQQQANNVMKYLWRAGINTRLLYSVGYGGLKPVDVAGATMPGDNDRIEITLEKLPV